MNLVALVGSLSRNPVVRFEGESQTAHFTLTIDEQSREGKHYSLYVPCASWGRSAEVCSLLNAGDVVSVQGKLSWRTQAHKCGTDHSQLVVQVREVTVLQPAPVEVAP